jgi:SPP1 gp7 family putative phage head morphogenesis protein
VTLLNISGNDILQAGGRPLGPMTGFGNDVQEVNAYTAFAAAAYCYVAIRYRMRKISEPPLMVVQEDPESGAETWMPDHPLAGLLSDPSPDFDMGRLLARTKAYLDVFGQALWVKDLNRGGLPARLMPFHGGEFQVEQRGDRMHGLFRLDSNLVPSARRNRLPEEVVFFQEIDPFSWNTGTSRVEVALSWLNLSTQALATTRDVLRNALFPSVIIQADPKWAPSPEMWAEFKQAVSQYADREKRGGPLTLTGGGSATSVSLSLRDMIPSEILARVESVVSAVFGIPAVVLQYQVGMENAPWSQMAEARRMAYEDTIEPEWRDIENALTRQLLWAPAAPGGRPLESDRSLLVRFDTSKIRALQADVVQMTQVAVMQERMASLNERRRLLNLDPSDDPRADEIPELRALDQAAAAPVLPAGFENPFAADATGDGTSPEEGTALPTAEEEAEAAAEAVTAFRLWPIGQVKAESARKATIWARFDGETKAATEMWEDPIAAELAVQRDAIVSIVERLADKGGSGPHETKAGIDPALAEQIDKAVQAWLKGRGQARMRAVAYPLVTATATSAVAAVASDLGLTFSLLQPGLLDFAARETVFLAQVMGKTTGNAVSATVQASLQEGETIRALTTRLRALPAFDRTRAKVTARTETTRAWNGAQVTQVDQFASRVSMVAVKEWLTAGDDRVREEHAAMEGERVKIDEEFSNGLLAPGEPNCRCTLLYELVQEG